MLLELNYLDFNRRKTEEEEFPNFIFILSNFIKENDSKEKLILSLSWILTRVYPWNQSFDLKGSYRISNSSDLDLSNKGYLLKIILSIIDLLSLSF